MPFGFSRVVFLSHVLDTFNPVFPGDPPVEITPAARIGHEGYHLHRVSFGEQAGTHWAAPAHFLTGGAAADELDPADFFRPAVVVDVRARVGEDPDFVLGPGDVARWEAAFGRIPAGCAVLMWTGFADRWRDPAAYLNADESGRLHYPGFGPEVTRWLIEQRAIAALGIDTMGIDPGADTSFLANRLLLADHRIHLENLTGLGQLPSAGGWVVVGGLRIRGGSGSPATVFGLVP